MTDSLEAQENVSISIDNARRCLTLKRGQMEWQELACQYLFYMLILFRYSWWVRMDYSINI